MLGMQYNDKHSSLSHKIVNRKQKFYKFCLRSGFPMSEVNELVEVRDKSDG
jgi:hypothetical protein